MTIYRLLSKQGGVHPFYLDANFLISKISLLRRFVMPVLQRFGNRNMITPEGVAVDPDETDRLFNVFALPKTKKAWS